MCMRLVDADVTEDINGFISNHRDQIRGKMMRLPKINIARGAVLTVKQADFVG